MQLSQTLSSSHGIIIYDVSNFVSADYVKQFVASSELMANSLYDVMVLPENDYVSPVHLMVSVLPNKITAFKLNHNMFKLLIFTRSIHVISYFNLCMQAQSNQSIITLPVTLNIPNFSPLDIHADLHPGNVTSYKYDAQHNGWVSNMILDKGIIDNTSIANLTAQADQLAIDAFAQVYGWR